MTDPRRLIHDWNADPDTDSATSAWARVGVHDETLRDGLQGPSVSDPTLEAKARLVRLLDALGVESLDVGLPGAGPRAVADVHALVRLIRDEGLRIRPGVACRTVAADIRPAIAVAEATGVPLQAMCFLGTSPLRQVAERWDVRVLERLTRTAVRLAADGGLEPWFVTEDTIRSEPDTLRRLFSAAIEEGAVGLVLCDTVGHATPDGTRRLVRWTRALLDELGVAHRVRLDWHGHDDRGLSLANSLAAAEAGVARVHACLLGIGERVGNTALDQVLVNQALARGGRADLRPLLEAVRLVSDATDTPIAPTYPVFGADAFRTATGVHAAAVIKALKLGRTDLADAVYSGVPARMVGLQQQIGVSFMSGASNVRWWLEQHGHEATPGRVEALLAAAKASRRLLSDAELEGALRAADGAPATEAPQRDEEDGAAGQASCVPASPLPARKDDAD